jgi:hypothetical protein
MDLLEIENAHLVSAKKKSIKLFDPKIKSKKGIIHIEGVLDFHEPLSKEKVKELEEHLGIHAGTRDVNPEDYLQITGTGKFGSDVLISEVHCVTISFSSLKATFATYGDLYHRNKYPGNYKSNRIYSIGLEGLKIAFERVTSFDYTRTILGEEQRRTLRSEWDYTEQKLHFKWKSKQYDHKITFLKSEDNLTVLRFEKDQWLELSTYTDIKQQLRAFLSYPNGNVLNFREEHFEENGVSFSKISSGKKVKNSVRSQYIPLHSIQFRSKNILKDYLNCFDNFLFVDQHLDLVGFVFLFNQSRKEAIDTSIFIMLIALEKIASNFIESDLFSEKRNTIIDPVEFNSRIDKTKEQFKKDFNDLKDFQKLNSKLGNLNQKHQTDKKIEALLDFARVKRTDEVEHLFTILRNKAIHQGKIDTIGENGFENYINLTLLCNRLLCNLIQYKGLRFVEQREQTNYLEQTTEYKTNYEKFR